MSTRFLTLLQREWMQHHRGWLLVMLIPPLLALLAMPFARIDIDDATVPPAMAIATAALCATALAVFGISWLITMFQMPGLARRDQQDRSIEFWLSLPGSHSESIGATLLAHAVLVPILALTVGAALGLLMAAAVVVKLAGLAALADVSWLALLAAATAGLLRLALGVVLMSLWFAPFILALMAASAWLKRWGTPALIVATLVLGNVLNKVYDNPIVWRLLQAQAEGASGALLDARRELQRLEDDGPDGVMHFMGQLTQWVVQDAMAAIGQLASPHLVGGLVLAAGCFGLLILHRRSAH